MPELDNMFTVVSVAGVVLVALILLGLILARLYKRASKEVSYVRTGFGGQRVIMNGGSLVFPILHEIIPVNMNTLRLEVHRANDEALITRDRMRVDVTAEFYVRVQPTKESIANAAQTLGLKTMHPDQLRTLVEGKFVDALRAVAAEMAMEELHEKRVDFVQKVQQVVSEDLLKNGLELESVSLTGLDQTAKEFFNPDNAFDAEGLTKLTQAIEERRKIRNDIEQDTNVAIAQKNLEAQRKRLEIQKEEEYALLAQQREIEIRRAQQNAEVAKEQADKQRDAKQAKITADQLVLQSQINSERVVEEDRIEKERLIREKDIAKARTLETAEIERRKAVELAEQERAIVIAEKSKLQSVAQAEADRARSEAVREEEAVVTVRDTERAERQKAVELVEARRLAEQEAIKIKVAAEAEKLASEDQAEAVRILATAHADKLRTQATSEADAEKLRAQAAEVRYAVDAAGKKALNEALNLLSPEQIAMQVRLELLKQLPDIIRESVKPMERIDGIKIFQVDGLGAQVTNGHANGNGTHGEAHGESSLADQVVNSALRYRSQAPLIDSLMQEIGFSGNKMESLVAGLHGLQERIAKREKKSEN